MRELLPDNVTLLKKQIAILRQELDSQPIYSKIEAGLAIEQMQTLDELEAMLNRDIIPKAETLQSYLAKRWGRIRHRPWGYTQRPSDPVNQLCLSIAHYIEPLPESKDEMDGLELGEGPYFILMPSLKTYKDATFTNIHEYALHEFVLSDSQTVFIPVKDCLSNAMESAEEEFRHVVSDPDQCYTLKLIHPKPGEVLSNDAIPEHVLYVYRRDGVIHCAAKNKQPFILSEEALIDIFRAQLSDVETESLVRTSLMERTQEKYPAEDLNALEATFLDQGVDQETRSNAGQYLNVLLSETIDSLSLEELTKLTEDAQYKSCKRKYESLLETLAPPC